MVSIIINNYNYGRFLAAAIESALQQTHPYCEVIVVDDGSTDHSHTIIQHYGSQIVSVLKDNGGQASALNAGFAQSQGELVIFLDADDLLLPQIAQAAWDAFQTTGQTAKVQYRMQVVDRDGLPTGAIKPSPHLPLPSGDLRRQELTFPFDLTWMATSGNAFARWALYQIMPIPEADFPILADYYLAHLTPLLGNVLFLDEIGACYRVHRQNHYALSTPTLNLEQIRRTILYAQRTHRYIHQVAGQLGLTQADSTAPDLSIVSLVNRLVSLRLDPARHPVANDHAWPLLLLGLRAAWRRFDVALPMRLLFAGWFLALTILPVGVAHRLAEQFFFPEKRPRLNRLLRILQGAS